MSTSLVVLRKPQTGLPQSELVNLRDFNFDELMAWLGQRFAKAPRYRTEQVFRALHQRRANTFADLSNLPASERQQLAGAASLTRLHLDEVHHGQDGTRKLRFRTEDHGLLESVLIPNETRGYTQCISSQIGCALTCAFCATASLGFRRNLATWEIVDQVYQAQDLLAKEAELANVDPKSAAKVANLVFMGMGEPLHNFNQVKRAIAILTHPWGAALGGRHITVSSSGLVPAIERFGREGLGRLVGLAISLNATTDEVRDRIMPINTRWNIATLLETVRSIPLRRRQVLTFEYVLLADVNDQDEDAYRLHQLLKEIPCKVNVIPFNPHPHAPFRRPSPERIQRFMDLCWQLKLQIHLRTPRGDDIGAACGQLALEGQKQEP